MEFIYIFLMVFLTVIGQLLTKKGTMHIVFNKGKLNVMRSFINIYIILGSLFTFFAPIFTILAYRVLPLSFVFSFTALNYIFVILGAKLFFRERLSIYNYIGVATIALGLIIFTFNY